MKIKIGPKGAKLLGIKPEMIPVFIITNEVFRHYSAEAVLTEGTGGIHRTIVHPLGMATDWGLSKLGKSVDKSIKSRLKAKLGDQYDVILESDHFHIEFDPR